ncbi:MAG: MobC family plasmid mobilization relaxosome protein [Clostridia bacterium]|nr:MobC family plasmid mobilization relaxosome protein [Clostridia bacterium]
MRKRNIPVKVMMDETEHNAFKNKLETSGLSQREYIQRLIDNRAILSDEAEKALRSLLNAVTGLTEQVRRIGVNVNQLARIANRNGVLPTARQLDDISAQLNDMEMEASELWQYIKS